MGSAARLARTARGKVVERRLVSRHITRRRRLRSASRAALERHDRARLQSKTRQRVVSRRMAAMPDAGATFKEAVQARYSPAHSPFSRAHPLFSAHTPTRIDIDDPLRVARAHLPPSGVAIAGRHFFLDK